MPIFKISLKIVSERRVYVIVYLVLMSSLGLVMGLANSKSSPTADSEWTPTVAIIDRDGSELSQGLADYVASEGEVQELEDTKRAMQDAIATDRITYILVIPEGFGEQMQRAFTAKAVSGAVDTPGVPQVQAAVSYSSAKGAFMDVRVNAFLDQVSDHLFVGRSPADSLMAAREASVKSAPVTLLGKQEDAPSKGFIIYSRFSLYPIFAFVVTAVMSVMIALNRRSIHMRLAASPATSRSTNLALLGTSGVVGLIAWAWVMALALIFFAPLSTPSGLAKTAIVSLALLAYTAVALSLAYLLGQLAWGENAANGFANLAGMLLSFLGGAWVDIELLPEGIVSAAHFTPAYWATTCINDTLEAQSVTWTSLPPLLAPVGICSLFALAAASVAFMIRRSRARAEL
ncbi:ABC transporter permease [Schaalia cardiffensis]|uniref:ABC transporter permease n=1 Tax=Schaalia cardiffensis TaxID=181487 RepID=UPI0023EFB1E9|nr:ABC transporter permease [Schaalia cardiffensis]